MARRTRAGMGQFIRSPDTVQRDAEACALRMRGLSYGDIARALGYADESGAWRAVKRALDATIAEPGQDVRALELARLDDLWRKALAIAERFHVAVSNGRVVYQGENPVEDDGPALQAIDRLLKIQERRARLIGLDAPVKHEVRNVDAIDAEIERLVAQLGARTEAAPAPEAAR